MGTIGESVTEATVKTFNKKVGDTVNVDEIVVVVESDKGEAPVRSTHKGVITNFMFKEGDDVKIGTPVFELDTDGSGKASDSSKTEAKSEPKKEAPKTEKKEEPRREEPKREEPKKEEPLYCTISITYKPDNKNSNSYDGDNCLELRITEKAKAQSLYSEIIRQVQEQFPSDVFLDKLVNNMLGDASCEMVDPKKKK